jgi:hypothetical protein
MSNFKEALDYVVGVDIFDENQKGSILDLHYFKLNVTWITKKRDEIVSARKALYVNCTSSLSFTRTDITDSVNQSFYDIYKMSTAICFRFDEFLSTEGDSTDSLELSGTDVAENEDYVSITIGACDNTTVSPPGSCASIDKIKTRMDRGIVRFYFTDQQFITNDTISSPVVNSTAYYKFTIQQYFSKSISAYVQNTTVYDYYNVLQAQPKPKFIFSYSSVTTDLNFVNTDEFGFYDFVDINVKVDTYTTIYTRKFMNIKDFFISIVGILNGMWAGGTAVGRILNGMLLRIDLINKSFFLIEDDNSGIRSPNDKTSNIDKNKIGKTKDFELISLKDKTDRGGGETAKNLNKDTTLDKIDKSNITLLDNKDNVDEGKSRKHLSMSKISEKDKEQAIETLKQNIEEDEENERRKHENDNYNIEHGMIVNPWFNDPKLILSNKPKKFSKFRMDLYELIYQMLPCCKNKKLLGKKKIFEDCGAIIEAFFDIERIIGSIREYQEFRNVVLSKKEYQILKQLTTPKIEIIDDEVIIKKAEKLNISEKELKKSWGEFVVNINKLVKAPYLTHNEYNLVEIHKMNLRLDENHNNG